jgi:integrase/recombinase XerD
LFDYLTDTKQVEGSPARLPKFSIGKSQEREILTVEEIIQVFECCKDKRERAILSLAYGCGLRRSEIKELNLMDVQLSKGMLVVRDGKNHRSRTIPVSNSVAKELREYVLYERTNYLKEDIVTHAFIVSDTGQRMTGQYLNDNVRAVMKRTDIKKHITLHCLRHSIATHMLDKGADIEFVKNFLGHISIDTSHIYSKRRKQRLNLKNQILA